VLCMLNLYTLVSGIIISYNGIIHSGQGLLVEAETVLPAQCIKDHGMKGWEQPLVHIQLK
ncbi:MAG: hypothetical protein ACOCVE_06240, partial [Desulfovermiculus sp.]